MHTTTLTRRTRRTLAVAAAAAAALTGVAANGAQAYPGGTFAQPDLVISAVQPGSLARVTVKNAGLRFSGSSQLKVSGVGTFYIPALESGASHTVTVGNLCEGTFTATADALRQVAESNETNNSRTFTVLC